MATTPTKNPSLLDVFQKNSYDLKTSVKKSRAWYEQQVLLLNRQKLTPKKVLYGETKELRSRMVPGSLYLYMYDPKYKDTLPYYDAFPLVFPYKVTSTGFMGLNFHYLPYQLRIQLLDRLMVFASNTKMDETTRIKYQWATIEGVSKFNVAKPCIKQYLAPHVRSVFRKINPEDWATAMMLPVETFVGASKHEVWLDSRKTIRQQ